MTPATVAPSPGAERGEAANWALPVLYVYLWFFLATPFTRFPFLTTIRFERILVVLIVATGFTAGALVVRWPAGTRRALVLYGWMLVCYALSPHRQFYLVHEWWTEYWKLIVFHLLVVWLMTSVRDVSRVLIAFAAATALYQFHSWWDFLHGGSYVYQQSIKRIIGVWSTTGSGAGNAFGFMAAVALPAVEFAFYSARRRWHRLLWVCVGVMGLASVVFSGTRAALVTVLFFGALHFRTRRSVLAGVVMLVMLGFAFNMLPESLQDRYSTILGVAEEEFASGESSDTAVRSGQTRLEGLRDGFTLAGQSPITGHGPGASMLARYAINPTPFREGREQLLQLHNLYGQVVAELGYPGLLLFIWLIVGFLRDTARARRLAADGEDGERIERLLLALQRTILILLFYGLFSHNLYRYHWLLFVALMASTLYLLEQRRDTSVRSVKTRPTAAAREGR